MAHRPETLAMHVSGHGAPIVTEHADDIAADLEQALAASK